MEVKQAIRSSSDNNSEAECEIVIEQLKNDEAADYLQAEDGSTLIGTYTVQDGELVYHSGPKCIAGKKARKYLSVDAQSSDTTLRFVAQSKAPRFA
jgi:hypothetical protein